MKLHTVFITYNRLELTKQAITSYLETVTVPHTLIVVDNASQDGTRKWLMQMLGPDGWRGFATNAYPGKACNWGWSLVPDDADFLHRADNDFGFLPGWCKQVEKMFRNKELGQLGLRTNEEENFAPYNVGGNCVIRRELWDAGLRYDERPWPQIREEVGRGHSEDTFLSPAVKQMGYKWGRVKVPCIYPLEPQFADNPYYIQSFGDRGIEWK